jgi:hypothetical protein
MLSEYALLSLCFLIFKESQGGLQMLKATHFLALALALPISQQVVLEALLK